MRKYALPIAVFLLLGGLTFWPADAKTPAPDDPSRIPWPAGLPRYDHIVIVVEENRDYDEIIDKADVAPYINSLRKEGASFTQMYGEEHFSQGNYFWLFSGSNQNVGFEDDIPPHRFDRPNLGAALIANNLSFKGYSEGLPAIGSEIHKQGLYARKHVPWITFKNVPNDATIDKSSNLRWDDFPADFSTLPTVAFVIPNLIGDMHNTVEGQNSITNGDNWLQQHLDPYYRWAKEHNSLLIVTFDESNDRSGYTGLTNPGVTPTAGEDQKLFQRHKDLQNRIATIFAGAHIKPGDYAESKGITHVNILRTIESMYGLPRSGAQQPNAAGIGIRDDFIITDIFQ